MPSKLLVWFPLNWRQKIQLIFLFQTILFFSKNTSFLFNLFAEIKKLSFPGKFFSCQNLRFKNCNNFFEVRFLVNKSLCEWFLKSYQDHVIFEFFSAFLTKYVTPLLFTRYDGNAWRAIALAFLFHNLYVLFIKKTEKVRRKSKYQRRFFCFSIFVGATVSYIHPLKIFIFIILRSFTQLQKQEFLKNSH